MVRQKLTNLDKLTHCIRESITQLFFCIQIVGNQ